MPSDFDIWRSPSGDPDSGDNEFVGIVGAENAEEAVAIASREVECQPPAVLWAEATEVRLKSGLPSKLGMKIMVIILALCHGILEIVAVETRQAELWPALASLVAAATSVIVALTGFNIFAAFVSAGMNMAVFFCFRPAGAAPILVNTILIFVAGLARTAEAHDDTSD